MTAAPTAAQLAAVCASVAARGTDPADLAAILAWSVGPRRSPDALRRACRDRVDEPATSLLATDGEVGEAPGEGRLERGRPRGARDAADSRRISAQLAAAAGPVAAVDVTAALPLVERWQEQGVSVAVAGDAAYPARLMEGWPHSAAPVWVAWRGVPAWQAPTVAIVGARRATGYGTGIAAWLADAAARAGVRVVSGGALGIDAAAHRAALEAPGGTTVVLGCGHAVGYPRPHARPGGLFETVVSDGGAVVSELLPHQPPRAGPVRARNRIVAGLADVVVVVEGGARSGALLTAGAAAERGRTVLAVPGDVRAAGSAAPHRLLADGVAPCTGPDDLLAALAGPGQRVLERPPGDGTSSGLTDAASACPGAPPGSTRPSTLPQAALSVLQDRWPRPVRLDDLARDAALPVPTLLAAVTRATVAGEVVDGVDGLRLRRAPDAAVPDA